MPQLCTMLDPHVLCKVAFVRTVAPSVNSHRTAGSLACDAARSSTRRSASSPERGERNDYRRTLNTGSKQGTQRSLFSVLNALHPFPHVEQRFKHCLPRGIFALGPRRTIGGGCWALCVLCQPLD